MATTGAETAATRVVEAAPAKLNLDLYVERRRSDGYHDLDSIVAFTDFGDTVEVSLADSDSLSIDGPLATSLIDAGETLIGRALDGLRRAAGSDVGFRGRLTKRIPLAAGLGGGSADAGAALRAGVRLLGLAPDAPPVLALAAQLGADVPACYLSRPVRLTGTGDTLRCAPDVPPIDLLLVNPSVPAPTAAVYRALDPDRLEAAPSRNTAGTPWPHWFEHGRNDLTAAALEVAPAIGEVIEALGATGARVVRLCGSGATVFAAFANGKAAAAAATRLRARRPGWWVREARLG